MSLPRQSIFSGDIDVSPCRKWIIEDVFSRVGNFDLVASEIKLMYEKLEARNISQDEIYIQVATQIHSSTKIGFRHWLASYIIAAFFVQNCEVFREITK